MNRQLSLAIGSAVALVVAAATIALGLNAGFVSASSAEGPTEEAPVTTTTTYEQYLEEWYAANPTTTALPVTTDTALPAESVVVYEYVDIPVTVPPPRVVYVPVPAEPTPTMTAPPSSTTPAGPAPSTSPTTTGGTAAPAPTAPTTAPPAPTTTAAPMDLLAFDVYGFADVTVASHGPGNRLQFWQIEQDSPWVWEIERDNGSSVEVKFFNTSSGSEAKFLLSLRDGGYRLKTEGDGFPETERNL